MKKTQDEPDDGGDTALFFVDGFVVKRDAVIIPAHFQDLPEAFPSRVLFFFGGKWYFHDFPNADIRSVTYQDGLCYLMGMNGVIHSCGRPGQQLSPATLPGSYQESVITDVDRYGALFGIRFIGGNVYTCGQSFQVYVLRGKKWVHFDDGILKQGGITLEDIDGTGPDDIYTVGWKGTICHFDGKRWRKLDSPTNQHLSTVRCISRDEVYICGNAGTVFRGHADAWEFIGDPDFSEHFWGMARFKEELYLAHNMGLMKHDGKKLLPVDIDIGRPLSCHRLHSGDGVLWSFGETELLCNDGTSWIEIVCPENV